MNNSILCALCTFCRPNWSCRLGFQASLPLPVNSVKNSQKEDKGSVVKSRMWWMQGMEGNLLGRGNCKTNPTQTPKKAKCWGVTVPKWDVTHLKAFFRSSVSLLWGFYTNAYQGLVWICFFTCFCIPLRQLCGSVLIHDPGLKCMFCTLLLEGRWLHVCASSLMNKSILYLLWLFNLACRSVWAFCWRYVDASLLVFHIVLSDPC